MGATERADWRRRLTLTTARSPALWRWEMKVHLDIEWPREPSLYPNLL
jgi:hypothetical protein